MRVFMVTALLLGIAQAQSTSGLEQLINDGKFLEAYTAASKIKTAAAQAWASRAANFYSDFVAKPGEKAQWYVSAEAAAKEALRLDNKYALGYLFLAQSQGRLSQYRGILESLGFANSIRDNAQKALELDPSLGEAKLTIAIWNQALVSSGVGWLYGANANTATDLMEELIQSDPNNIIYRLEYGNLLVNQHKKPEALKQYQTGLRIAPKTVLDRLMQDGIKQAVEKIN